MYSNNEKGMIAYVQDVGQKFKSKGTAAMVGFGLLALTACGGVKTTHEPSLPSTSAKSVEKLEQNQRLYQERLGDCVAPNDAYGRFLQNVFSKQGNHYTLDELSQMSSSVDPNRVTQEDLAVGDPACLYLPNKIHIGQDLKQGSLDNLVSNYTTKEEFDSASKKNEYVSGGMYKRDGFHLTVPEGDHSLLQIFDKAMDNKFDGLYGDLNVDEISTYDLKQDNRRLGTLTVYQIEGEKGTVIPKVDIFGNGYSVGGKYLSPEEINKSLEKRATRESERRDRDVSASEYRVSHETSSSGAMEARGISAALTGGAGVLLHPLVGAGVFAANLFKTAEFDKVISYNNFKEYSPGRSLSDILSNERDSSTTTIVSPIYGENNQVSGFLKYDLNPTNKNVVVGKTGIHVEESNKLLKGIAGDVLRLGAAALLYEVGKSDGDETIRKREDEPTGGVTRPGGSGPGVRPR